MENKKYQIFVSSTFRDLEKERNKVIETILNLGHFPIGMETFGADADNQWDIIKETIDSSDYYLIIVGQRYGTLASDGISYTEKEFDYAFNNGIPIFGYVQHRHVSTTPDKRDQDPVLVNKLTDFVTKVTNGRMCSFWEDMKDLGSVVATNLPKAIRRTPRVGWIKASEANSPEVANELARLSSENSELRLELASLKKAQYPLSPYFEVLINKQKDAINITDYVKDFSPIELPSPIKLSDAPIQILNHVTSNDLKNYNEKIPSAEEASNFDREVKAYLGGENGNFIFDVEVKNIGNVKANDIQIEIRVPDFLKFYKKDASLFTEIPKISIPELPWMKIMERIRPRFGFDSMFGGDDSGLRLPYSNFYRDHINTLASVHSFNDRISSKIVNDQKVKIKIKDLLHTKNELMEDFYLFPISSGDGELSIEVICEELGEPLLFKMPIRASTEQ